jgi:L-alanine-DL-glutamate epimerase-like enolase superfamily enzyme
MTAPHELRLRRVDAIRYHMPLKRAYGTARGVATAGINFLVRLAGESGDRRLAGVGECQPRHALTGDGGKDRAAAWAFLCAAAGSLPGRVLRFTDPTEAIRAVRDVMAELAELAASHADDRNRDRPFRGTLLGLEVALLDLAARVFDLRISELLGQRRDAIGVSISTISSNVPLAEVAERVIKQVRFPMTRVKGIGELDYDLRLLEVVSQANRSVGREKPLWIDINEALDQPRAAEFVRVVAGRMGSGRLPASLVIEGMLAKSEVERLPALQRLADQECRATVRGTALDLRIMPDEGFWDVQDLRRLTALGGCRAFNIKAPKAGGLLASLELANAAVAADPDVHLCLGGMVGTSDITAWALHNLARALPRIDYLTTVPPQNVAARIAEPVARYRERGSNLIAPQEGPGLGTSLRMDQLAPYVRASFDPSEAVGSTTRQTASAPISPVQPAEGTATLVFAGDTSLGDVFVHRTGGALQKRLEQDPMSFFDGLRPVVADPDLFVLNLETVLANAPTSPFEGRKSFLGWDFPDRTIGCLRELRVGAVSLANNHTMDFGAEHLLATRHRLAAAGIAPFGAGASRTEAAAPFTFRFADQGTERRVHIFAAMQLQPKLRDEFGCYAGRHQPGVNGLAVSRISASIAALRAADPTSLIVVFPHWGRNYQWADEKLQRVAEAFTEAGAALVIGHGAHMLAQCAFSAHHAIVYSLGNFMFNWAGRFDRFGAPPYGLVTRVGVSFRPGGWAVDLRAYPILVDNRVTDHRPVTVDEPGFEAAWSALAAADLDRSFLRHARAGKDGIGYHIGYSFATVPAGR